MTLIIVFLSFKTQMFLTFVLVSAPSSSSPLICLFLPAKSCCHAAAAKLCAAEMASAEQ